MQRETGYYQVMRNCCTSGNCTHCFGVWKGTGGPLRVVQADNYSKAYATYVASNWGRYAPTVERMPMVFGIMMDESGDAWKFDAVSREAARDAIAHARASGAVGTTDTLDETGIGGEKFLLAQVWRLDSAGNEVRPKW